MLNKIEVLWAATELVLKGIVIVGLQDNNNKQIEPDNPFRHHREEMEIIIICKVVSQDRESKMSE